MRRKICSILSAVLLASTMSLAFSSQAEAAVASSGGSSCTVTLSSGNMYYGSTLVGYARVVNSTCAYVQAHINYLASSSSGVYNTAGSKTSGTSTAYAGTTLVVSRTAYIWVTSGKLTYLNF